MECVRAGREREGNRRKDGGVGWEKREMWVGDEQKMGRKDGKDGKRGKKTERMGEQGKVRQVELLRGGSRTDGRWLAGLPD